MQSDFNGKDLANFILRNSPIDIVTVTKISIQLVAALQETHSLGIIHKVQTPTI
jgi:serine/threonine protein kinase